MSPQRDGRSDALSLKQYVCLHMRVQYGLTGTRLRTQLHMRQQAADRRRYLASGCTMTATRCRAPRMDQ
jgi:hypothetical protein